MPFVEPREPSTIQFTIDSAQHCPYFYAKDSLRLRPSKNQKEPLNSKFQMKMDTCRRGYKNKIDGPGWAGKVWAVPFPPTQTENFCVTYLGMFTSPRSAVPSPSRLHRGKTDPNVVYSSYRPRKSSDKWNSRNHRDRTYRTRPPTLRNFRGSISALTSPTLFEEPGRLTTETESKNDGLPPTTSLSTQPLEDRKIVAVLYAYGSLYDVCVHLHRKNVLTTTMSYAFYGKH